MGYLIRPLRGHLPLKGKAGGCHFKAFPFRGRWLAEGQTDEAGGQRPPAGRRGRRPLRQNRKIPPSRRGGCPHPPAPEDSSTRRGGTPDRPETARWGHRALQKIKSTSGYSVGAGVLTRPPQRIPPTRRGGYQPPVSNRVPFMVGPASVRPLRHARNGFVFCKGGLQTRLPFLEIRRGAQCAPAGRSGTGPYGVHRTGFCIFVGAAPCGRPQFYYIHTEKGGINTP